MNLEKVTKAFLLHRKKIYWLALVMVACLVHFHDTRVFSRALIDHDDTIFIQPLMDMSLSDYLSHWLPNRLRYGFPLRDLTFLLDFKLSAALGVQTYWISNFVFFIFGVFFASRLFTLLFPGQAALVQLLTAIVALHPLNVEMVQWASMRKHLLAAMLITYGAYRVFQLYCDAQRKAGLRDLGHVMTVTVISLFCWPSAIVFPLAALWVLRHKLRTQNAPLFALFAGALVFWAVAFRIMAGHNSDYARNETTLLTGPGLQLAWQWGWRGLGRATFNLLLPFREAAYYDAASPLNVIGLAIFGALAVWFSWLAFWSKDLLVKKGGALFSMAAILFVAQFFVVLINSGFVWADHYLYTSFPFIVAGSCCFLLVGLRPWLARLHRASAFVACAGLGALYVVCAVAQVPDWNDAISLLQACAKRENAPYCRIIALEKSFDVGGCARAFPFFDDARHELATRRENGTIRFDKTLELELPLVESYCTASASNVDQARKTMLLDEQEKFYGKPTSLLFSRVVSALRGGDFQSAWKFAVTTYLNPQYTIIEPNEKMLTILGGQAEAICALSESLKIGSHCHELLTIYRKRTAPFIFDGAFKAGAMTAWGKQVSLDAFSLSSTRPQVE